MFARFAVAILIAATITVGDLQRVDAAQPAVTCRQGGPCKPGDRGPGGGVVVHDAGTTQWWVRYLEAHVVPRVAGIPWAPNAETATLGVFLDGMQSALRQRIRAKGVGFGRLNTAAIVSAYGEGTYAAAIANAFRGGGKADWYLPAKNELDMVLNVVRARDVPQGDFDKGYYWTSSDYNNVTAWTQYFTDGQQFDRVQTLTANKQPPNGPFRVRMIRAFG